MRFRTLGALGIGLLLLAAMPHGAEARQQPAEDRTWGGIGIGVAAISDEDGDGAIHLTAHFAHQRGSHVVTLRGSAVAELFDNGGWDLGLLYGRATTGSGSHHSISAGLALVGVEECQGLFGGPCTDEQTVGIPIAAVTSLEAASFFGAGLELSANLNPKSSWIAGALVIRLGALR